MSTYTHAHTRAPKQMLLRDTCCTRNWVQKCSCMCVCLANARYVCTHIEDWQIASFIYGSFVLRPATGLIRSAWSGFIQGFTHALRFVSDQRRRGGTPQANRQGLTAQAWDAGRRVQHADISLCGGLGICPLWSIMILPHVPSLCPWCEFLLMIHRRKTGQPGISSEIIHRHV